MKKALYKYGFIALFASAILFTYLQVAFELIKEPRLRRSLPEVVLEPLNTETWFSAKWQSSLNDYTKRNFGFFNSSFLEYNQLDFSLFNKVHARDVVIGEDNFLYEKDYIDAYYGNDLLSDSLIDVESKKLKMISDYLDSVNTKLVVLFAPGKASFYPEYFPENLRQAAPGKTNNSEFEKAFKKQGINYINLRDWFLEMKDTSSYPLVPQTGIHWSYYGMLLATDSIINYTEELLNKQLPNIELGNIVTSKKPKSTDGDIEYGLNVFEPLNKQVLAYPRYKYEVGDFDTVKAILVGDSYGLGLHHRAFLTESFSNGQFWFYFKRNYRGTKPRTNLLYENWQRELEQSDVVFIISTEATMKRFGFGFIESAFFKMYPNHVLNKAKKKKLSTYKADIKNDPTTLERLEAKAITNKIDIDLIIELEAEYRYRLKNN